MKTVLYAQPYDLSARGFLFSSAEDYASEAKAKTNKSGQPVEEFEIQFIDGERIDAELFKVMDVNQGDIADFFDAVQAWDISRKRRVIIAVRENDYLLSLKCDEEDLPDIDLFELESLRELAQLFVEDGYLGEIPERLQAYIDYDLVAIDLAADYARTSIAGQPLIYRCD